MLESYKRYTEYLKYVIRHKWYVFIACRRLGKVSLYRALVHDNSKFSLSEFIPYARYFYLSNGKSRRGQGLTSELTVNFNKAWLHHQKYNKHHWQYWLSLDEKGQLTPIEMPVKYVYEMVADWVGAGKAITGDWCDYYAFYIKKKDDLILHQNTRELVNHVVNLASPIFS